MKRIHTAILIFILMLISPNSFSENSSDIPQDIMVNAVAPGSVMMVAGEKSDDMIGLSVASGDINGDGYDDIVIGAPEADADFFPDENGIHTDDGLTYVIFGSAQISSGASLDLNNRPSGVLRIKSGHGGDKLGSWVVTADLNSDGFDDIIIPAQHADPHGRMDAGQAYIVFGSAGMRLYKDIDLSTYDGSIITVSGEMEGDNLGFLGSKGDINGDGYEDAILKAYLADPFGRVDAGVTYVVFGSKDLPARKEIDLAGTHDGVLKVYGIGCFDNSCDSTPWATGSGDINGDGYDDLLIGSRLADPDGKQDAGETYVIFGSSRITSVHEIDLRDSVPNIMRIYGTQSGEQAGNIVVSGDVNADGYDDVVIDALEAGKLYVVLGYSGMATHERIPLDNSFSGVVTIAGDNLNSLCPSVGDIDGDGISDIVMGAAFKGTGGKAYIIFGSKDFQDRTFIDVTNPQPGAVRIITSNYGEYLGFRTAAGDINGDGFADVILSAHGADPLGRENAGRAYIVWGRNTWEIQPPVETPAHFTYERNTGNNAIILIPSDTPPAVNGIAIVPGDEIGVFTPAGLCAGAGNWNGMNLAITVWGDNSYEEGVNGFLPGEKYLFKVWRVSEHTEYVVEPEYETGPDSYQVDGLSVIKSLETKMVTIVLHLEKGWNLISSPLALKEKPLEKVFADILDNVMIVKNGRGQVYLPSYNVNQIPGWEIKDGYQLYVQNNTDLNLSGWNVFVSDIKYELLKNWSLISFIGPDGMSPTTAFNPIINNMVLVKSRSGSVFWPEYEIDQIGSMSRGEGYWVYLLRPAAFSYPVIVEKKYARVSTPAHFIPVGITGNNATLLIKSDITPTINDVPLSTGDEIGVFSKDGICAGAGVWEENKNLAITVWGDNEITEEKDGMSAGETYQFYVWDIKKKETFNAWVLISTGDPFYTPNGITILKTFAVGEITPVDESAAPGEFVLYQNHPNPFNPVTLIPFSLPHECMVSLKIYNGLGEEIATLADGIFPAGYHTVRWDAETYANGIYFYRLTAGAFTETKRMTLVK